MVESADSIQGGFRGKRLGFRFLLLCCVLGYAVRFGFLVVGAQRFSGELGDQMRYLREVRNLVYHGTFAISLEDGPTAFDGPGYAFFLVPFLKWFGELRMPGAVAVAQAVLSILTAWMIGQITYRITGRICAARIALFWWCLYPFAVFYSAYLLSETLYTAFVVASIWCAYFFVRHLGPRSAIALGVVLGLTSLTRPTINGAIPFLFLAILAARWDERRKALKGLVLAGVALSLVLSPWIIRNYVVFGKILPGSTQVGRMLFLANNPDNETGGVLIPRDANPPDRRPDESELEYNNRLGKLAKEFIRENPGQFLKLVGMRFYQFWRLTPMYETFSSVLTNTVCFLSFLPLFVGALYGMWLLRHRFRILLPILAVVLSTYAIHLVFGVSLRYRFPIESLLVPPAAYAVSRLAELFKRSEMAGQSAGGRTSW